MLMGPWGKTARCEPQCEMLAIFRRGPVVGAKKSRVRELGGLLDRADQAGASRVIPAICTLPSSTRSSVK